MHQKFRITSWPLGRPDQPHPLAPITHDNPAYRGTLPGDLFLEEQENRDGQPPLNLRPQLPLKPISVGDVQALFVRT